MKERVNGPLKLHHEFRVTVSDCPNACSRPQIVDVGLIGALKLETTNEVCSECQACVDICKEKAISIANGVPIIDESLCLYCGQCVNVCPTGTITEGKRGYRVLVGGKLGRHPRLGEELGGIHEKKEALIKVERSLDHYQKHCLSGERFGEILEKTGTHELDK